MMEIVWKRYDPDDEGFLQRREFSHFFDDIFKGSGMEGMHIDTEDIDLIYEHVDKNANGVVSKDEMISFIIELFYEAHLERVELEEPEI